MTNNLTYPYTLRRKDKETHYKHSSIIIWFFGLSGSGKSTLCNSVEKSLFLNNIKTVVLDGDSLRKGLNNDLGFSKNHRSENLRRVSEMSKILLNNGLVTLCSFITPLKKNREIVNSIIGRENIYWIFVDTPLKVCYSRDAKGLYKLAKEGKIKEFTGVTSSFETPSDFDFKTNYNNSLDEMTNKLTSLIIKKIKIK